MRTTLEPRPHWILGTAGHIDHGKTSLVGALTGVDTDRLPEEKRRGITIVLGFAPLDLPNGVRIGVVDVPGHERFVKNMVAGAFAIDLALLVVAGDEGVMPQTREHLEICQLLGVKKGIIAVTKIDRAGPELALLAADDVRSHSQGTFLEDAPIILCSSKTGEGLDVLKNAIEESLGTLHMRPSAGALLLPIDRSFSMKGFGSIVTGTLVHGSLATGDVVDILPTVAGRPEARGVRVRSIQVFNESVERASAGERIAVNLQGVDLDRLSVGQVVVTPGTSEITRLLAVDITHLPSRDRPLKSGARFLFHTGTALVEAGITLLDRDRLEPGESGFANIRLREPIATMPGQRYIARGFDQVEDAGRTIAGGSILDTHPVRRRRHAEPTKTVLSKLQMWINDPGDADRLNTALLALVEERQARGLAIDVLARRLGKTRAECEAAVRALVSSQAVVETEGLVVDVKSVCDLGARALEILRAFHREHPFRGGMALAELITRVGKSIPGSVVERAAKRLIETRKLVLDREGLRAPDHQPTRTVDSDARGRVTRALEAAALEPPTAEALEREAGLKGGAFRDLMAALARSGEIVHAGAGIYFARAPFDRAKADVLGFITREGSISTAQAKALIGVSRKYLIPLLEALDKLQFTVRVGDVRKARSGGGGPG